MILKQTDRSVVELENNVVKKTYYDDRLFSTFTPEWIEVYTQYASEYKQAVPLIKVEDRSVYTQYIEGENFMLFLTKNKDSHTLNDILNYTTQIHDIINSYFQFSQTLDNKMFYHNDLHLDNILITPDKKLYVMDIDAYSLNTKKFLYSDFMFMYSQLVKVFHGFLHP